MPVNTMDGTTATAYAAYALSDKLILNTLSSEDFSDQRFSNHNNCFEAKTEVEIGLVSVADTMEPGKLVSACVHTSSLQSTVPALLQIARAQQPIVLHAPASNMQEVSVVAETGVSLLAAFSPQEAHDMAIVAHLAAIDLQVPMMTFFEAAACSNVNLTPFPSLAKLVNPDSLAAVRSLEPTSTGPDPISSQPHITSKYLMVPDTVDTLFESLAGGFGCRYKLFDYQGPANATKVVVVLGSGEVDEKFEAEAGVLQVRMLRPWSAKHFLAALPASTERVAVVDVSDDQILFRDVTGAFYSGLWEGTKPQIVSAQTDTFAVPAKTIKAILSNLSNRVPKSSISYAKIVQTAPTATQEIDPDESTMIYMKMLDQLFEDRLHIIDATSDASIFDAIGETTDSTEFALGKHLALLQQRTQLMGLISTLLEDPEVCISSALHTALGKWLQHHDEVRRSTKLAADIESLMPDALSKNSSPLLHEIKERCYLLPKPSLWIVGGASLANELKCSGVHHLLQCKENVKLLILQRSEASDQGRSNTTRDVGLYAMNYGSAYVASIGLPSFQSSGQAVSALTEADAFDGPSVVLGYLTSEACNNEQEEVDAVVTSGAWPLYRWNPHAQDSSSFVLDSQSVKDQLKHFLHKENNLSLLVNDEPSMPHHLVNSEDKKIADKHSSLASEAETKVSLMSTFMALKAGMGGAVKVAAPMAVVWGSDTGNAEKLAKQFASKANGKGFKAKAMEMNDLGVEGMAKETMVVFFVATAGQGEFCGNSKVMWDEVKKASSIAGTVNFAVFGLGDSHYWPGDDGAKYFCKSARDLDTKLSALGAKQLMPVGLGDDQHADGFKTEYDKWEPDVLAKFQALSGATSSGEEVEVKPRSVEQIKFESNYLRGTIVEGLNDLSTGALYPDDTNLIKFHGSYQQDDRELREERQKKKQEKAYSFMIRVRVPGGAVTPAQWVHMDELSAKLCHNNLKISTRQAFQVAGIIKSNLKAVMQGINQGLMDSIAACGDVNRNVMVTADPVQSEHYDEVQALAVHISEYLLPKTTAYHEIWLDKKLVAGEKDEEPLYGDYYLPRKFKIAIAVPPMNDVDIHANDCGFIAIIEGGRIVGYNVSLGGGLGTTHNNKATYPRPASVIGFCTPEQCHILAEQVITVQRDYGDRANRKLSRLKYTIDKMGMDKFIGMVEERLGWKISPPRKHVFEDNHDRFGWHQNHAGLWNYGCYVAGGRVKDFEGGLQTKTCLRKIAEIMDGEFRMTGNQNVVLANVSPSMKPRVEALLQQYNQVNPVSPLMKNHIACASLPMCGLAFAEAERYLPALITKMEGLLDEVGLSNESINIRMTGCPNGCGRPFLAEIAYVGKAPGIYNMYLGASHNGDRVNKMYKQSLNEQQMLDETIPLIKEYAKAKKPGEWFGDWVIRAGYITETKEGKDFWENAG